MPKREFLYEWMHRFDEPAYTRRESHYVNRLGLFGFYQEYQERTVTENVIVRVWSKPRQSEVLSADESMLVQRSEILKAITHWRHCTNKREQQLLDEIAKLDFVNAVEVLDKSGNGRLVYVDWP